MHWVYFSHLEVPADSDRGKKKVYLGLDIKVQFEGEKIVLSLCRDLKITLLRSCFSGLFMKEVMDHV